MSKILTVFVVVGTFFGGIFLTSDSVETKQSQCIDSASKALNPSSPNTLREIERQCKDIYK